MKRICLPLVALGLLATGSTLAQDATEARLIELGGRISALEEAQGVYKKQLNEISQQLDRLAQAINKPQANYATQEEVAGLTAKLKEVDSKRQVDFEKIKKNLETLEKTINTAISTPPPSPPAPKRDEKGFEHKIEEGQTISLIVAAFRAKGINVTTQDILKANPGLKPDRLKVGQVIWIPEPSRK